jgi:hypothetical protein
MIKQAIPCILVITFAAAGCGWFNSTPAAAGDGDVAEDDVTTPDEVQPDQPGDVPIEEGLQETQDPPLDPIDAQEDPAGDVPGEEIAPDVEPDAADTVGEDASGPCLPLTGTVEGVSSWTNRMPGSTSTIATFTLGLANRNVTGSSCIFSGIRVVEGFLKRATDDSPILTYTTVGPVGIMDTTLAPGGISGTAFRAECSGCIAPCDIEVIVEVSVEYVIEGVASPPVKIESAPTMNTCVY